jgi:hypothetical protein
MTQVPRSAGALNVLSVGGPLTRAGDPEVIDVSYDLWLLRVTVSMAGDDRRRVYVTFDAPIGFRVLDEGDLCEFWSPDVRTDGWLWEVTSGGWLDLERRRPNFIAGMNDQCREFLVLGCDACVS